MDRKVFYDQIRISIFRGRMNQSQVNGTNAILDEWAKRGYSDRRELAYELATAYHETAHTMQPITEYGGRAYFNKYETGTRIGKNLGNTRKGDGYKFRGRGYVQLTGRANYDKMSNLTGVDLLSNPELALDPEIAAQIMFEGMTRGSFTGRKLSDYFTETKTDWVSARRIINGTDRASLIAGYARKFHAALAAASEPFKSPQALKRSRTMAMAGAATVSGAGKTTFDAVALYDTATQADGYISRGDIIGMTFGAALLLGGLYIGYVRWDDAGRPSLREIVRGWN